MKEPLPAKGKPAKSVADARGSMKPQARVSARFYKRMQPQRVYPLVVQLRKEDGRTPAGETAPVVIRPFIPGAQVMPARCQLDTNQAKMETTFYVTPLALGRFPGARLEVYQDGNLLQNISVSMKCVRQRLTWVLLALTFLIPAFLLYATKYHPLQVPPPVILRAMNHGDLEEPPAPARNRDAAVNPIAPGQVHLPGPRDELEPFDRLLVKAERDEEPNKQGGKIPPPATARARPAGDEDPNKKGGKATSAKAADRTARPPRRGGTATTVDDDLLPDQIRNPNAGANGKANSSEAKQEEKTAKRKLPPITPGQVLRDEITAAIPEIPEEWKAQVTWLPDIIHPAAEKLGWLYDMSRALEKEHLSYYIFLVLLAVTVISWVFHRGKRGSRRGKMVTLAPATSRLPPSETLPLGHAQGAPAALAPAMD